MEETLIAADTKVTGVIEAPGSVRIAGWFEGRLILSGTLLVDRGGTVRADCLAERVIVAGSLHGNLTAQAVEVRAGATLIGEVSAPDVAIHDGATFRGRFRAPTAQLAAAAPPRSDRALASPAPAALAAPPPPPRNRVLPHRPRPHGRQRIARR